MNEIFSYAIELYLTKKREVYFELIEVFFELILSETNTSPLSTPTSASCLPSPSLLHRKVLQKQPLKKH